MNVVILIVIAALIVVVVIAAVIALFSVRPNGKKNNEIYYLDGADVDSGRLSADNNFFKGMSGALDETVVVGGGRTKPSGITVSIKNRSDHSICRMTIAEELTLGREAAFAVRDRSVSRIHCKISPSRGRLYLSDLGSANHTFLNGRQIADTVELKNGDVIRIGKTELEITF